MKKSQIIGLLAVVVLIAIIIATLYDADAYGNIRKARENKGQTFQIIGKLDKSKAVIFDPSANNMRLEFFMCDENNDTVKVVYWGEKPRDFEKLEQVVVTGMMKENYFEATTLLLKCPSKYTKDKTGEQQYESIK